MRSESLRDLFRDYPKIDAVTFSMLVDVNKYVHVTITRKEFLMNDNEAAFNDLVKVRMQYRGIPL